MLSIQDVLLPMLISTIIYVLWHLLTAGISVKEDESRDKARREDMNNK